MRCGSVFATDEKKGDVVRGDLPSVLDIHGECIKSTEVRMSSRSCLRDEGLDTENPVRTTRKTV